MDINNINKIINDYNEKPSDDFVGFSPKEMHEILYNPFEESCPIKIKKKITATVLEKIPAFQICKNIINSITEADGIKLTKTGNFPPITVQGIYDKKYIEDRFIESGITKLRTEKDWLPFHSLRIALSLGGLIRKYKGKVILTKKCKSYLLNKNDSLLFKDILISYCNKFNWTHRPASGASRCYRPLSTASRPTAHARLERVTHFCLSPPPEYPLQAVSEA